MPTEFRERFEQWWDELIAEGERQKFPYLPDRELMADLDGFAADAPERAWVHAMLIEWLASDDTLRWQPALGLLRRERVSVASSALRAAVDPPNTDDKRALSETFRRVADELDAQAADSAGSE